MNKNIIYLDNAATTRTDPRVINEMLKYFDILYGNPSSVYEFAGKSKDAIEKSRHIIAKSLKIKNLCESKPF
jgi:cysteine desulfurase